MDKVTVFKLYQFMPAPENSPQISAFLVGLYEKLNFINQPLTALVATATTVSINPEFTNWPWLNFLLAYGSIYIITAFAQLLARKYQPKYMIKSQMNTADWIDTHIGAKQHYELLPEDLYRVRYQFDLSFVTYILAFFWSQIFALVLIGVDLWLLPRQGALTLVPDPDFFLILLIFVVYFVLVKMSINLSKYVIEEKKISDQIGICIYLTLIVITLCSLVYLIFIN